MTVKFMGSRKQAFWQKGGGFSHVFALPVNTIEIPPHTLDYTASRQMIIIIILIQIVVIREYRISPIIGFRFVIV